MKILLLGADGQLGRRLRASLAPLGVVIALAREGDGALCGDLADAPRLASTVRAVQPDAIVNAAAYTAVDRAENERDLAFAVNATACEVLAREAHALGAWLVHYSTDYVFDGSGERAWREDDAPAPLNVYGASKLAGEQAIAREHDRFLILRTSWVFDSIGQNFLKAILKAARERDSLTVVDDQWGAPTSARLLADITAQVLPALEPRQAGLYHLAARGFTNRFEFARFALACAEGQGMPLTARAVDVRRASTAGMNSAARRPLNSRLDVKRFETAFRTRLPPWEDGVRLAVAELATERRIGP